MTFLDDVTVLDVTQVVSGSFASMLLADLGATVVKVEKPGTGDLGRANPPFVNGHSAYFTSVNRNKQSIALDLKSEGGRQALVDLAAEADVLVENYAPGRMAEFDLTYDDLRPHNEGLVYCSISGFGQTGPYAEYPALDMVAQAMSGQMSITGPPDDKPYRAGIPIADIAASMYAAQSVVAALYRRRETGEGEYLDVAMTDSLLSWLTVRAAYTFATGERYPRLGNGLNEFVPYNIFPTADSYLVVIAVGDHHWRRLCEAIDRPDLADDERFATVDARREHRDEIESILTEALATGTTQEWFETLADHGVVTAPVYDTAAVWDDPQVASRDLRSSVSLDGESFPVIDYPVQFERTDLDDPDGPPKLGEHTRDILRAAGYDDDEVDALVEAAAADVPDAQE